jgi:hypothetical protein
MLSKTDLLLEIVGTVAAGMALFAVYVFVLGALLRMS